MTLSVWLGKRGVESSSITFQRAIDVERAEVAGTGVEVDKGFGLFSGTADLARGSVIVSVPASALLSAASADDTANTGIRECVSLLGDLASERTKILCVLLANDEEWAEYVRVLPSPRDLHTPAFYEDHSIELAALSGTGVDAARAAKLKKLHREYQLLLPALRHLDPLATEEDALDDHHQLASIPFERFLWADAVFWSRVISFKSAIESGGGAAVVNRPDLHMVPLIDFANHSQSPECHWKLEMNASNSAVASINLVVSADAPDIPPNRELHISYGDKPNAELLFIHGFTLANNPHDSIVFQAPILELSGDTEEDALAFKAKLQLISSLGLTPSITLKLPTSAPESRSNPTTGPLLGALNHILDADSLLIMLISVLYLPDFMDILHSEDLTAPALWTALAAHETWDILLLRAWTILLQLVQERLDDLTASEPSLDAAATDSVASQQRLRFVRVLREGHEEILGTAVEILGGLQAEYAEREGVVAYLAQMRLADRPSEEVMVGDPEDPDDEEDEE
ncbi:hypothetical protein BC830DRAFT_1126519 [Chytriomyces sp. MP71]|nr:hypothetical protein BC830DRAFT_1126519 [Chytriomyces sp. MP71]